MSDPTKKSSLSSKLHQMKFMQRAQEHKRLEAAEAAAAAAAPAAEHQDHQEETPVETVLQPPAVPLAAGAAAAEAAAGVGAPGFPGTTGTTRGCRVVYDRDPLPQHLLGRMSFNKCNPAIEKLQAQPQQDIQAPAASQAPVGAQPASMPAVVPQASLSAVRTPVASAMPAAAARRLDADVTDADMAHALRRQGGKRTAQVAGGAEFKPLRQRKKAS
ncbi:hypothetical protein V8C86DRAFT_3141345 [Haematococcus lacustris]